MDTTLAAARADQRQSRLDASQRLASRILVAAMAVVALAAVALVIVPPDWAVAMDNGQQLVATLGATAAMLVGLRRATGFRRTLIRGLVAGLVIGGAGMVVWGVAPGGSATAGGPAAVLLFLALAAVSVSLVRAFARDLDRSRLGLILLDGMIAIAGTWCLLAPVWHGLVTAPGTEVVSQLAATIAVAAIALPMAGYLSLVDRRLVPGMLGPYAVLNGLTVAGLGWLAWLVLLARGDAAQVSEVDFAYSVAVLFVAWGGITWDIPPRRSILFERLASTIADAFPVVLVAICMTLVIVTRGHAEAASVLAGASALVALAVARQWLLVRTERVARMSERAGADRLAREVAHRSEVLASLSWLDAAPTLELTAQRICDRAITIDGIEQAGILLYDKDGFASLVAEAGPVATIAVAGRRQASGTSAHAPAPDAEPWVEALSERTDGHAAALRRAGITIVARAPIVAGDRAIGIVSLASADDDGGALRRERLVTSREFGALAGAMLGPIAAARARDESVREEIRTVIETAAFRIVFQPIVDLVTRRIVGFEALTRFADGTRPDERFERAAGAGLGLDLERVTLQAAVRDGAGLPGGAYLSLNASPELVLEGSMATILSGRAGRAIVLEITEHGSVADYSKLRSALLSLRGIARIAIDDVGAGYAGLRHILEIKPDILKLDIGLVRAVEQDAAKRALIGSIVTFAADTRSTLLAEGVETEAEAAALVALGVTLGQGYLFGRPAPARDLAPVPAGSEPSPRAFVPAWAAP